MLVVLRAPISLLPTFPARSPRGWLSQPAPASRDCRDVAPRGRPPPTSELLKGRAAEDKGRATDAARAQGFSALCASRPAFRLANKATSKIT